MFVFCVNLLKYQQKEANQNKIVAKVNFLFNGKLFSLIPKGLQIHKHDTLAVDNFHLKNNDWSFVRVKLLDYFNTQHGKVLPLLTHTDISFVQEQHGLPPPPEEPPLQVTDNIEELISRSPDIKLEEDGKGERLSLSREIGGNIYKAFKVQSLIKSSKKDNFFKLGAGPNQRSAQLSFLTKMGSE